MDSFEYDTGEEPLNEDQVIDEFLGEKPRARELRLMRMALVERRNAFAHDRDRAKEEQERAKLDHKLAELNRQIAAIREEEAITHFVEDSVRATLHRPSLEDLEG